MKSIYMLACVLWWGIVVPAKAQDNVSDGITAEMVAETGEVNTIFNTPIENKSYGGCSLVQNDESTRKISIKKDGYTIVTEDNDEVVQVRKHRDGKVLKYDNGYESLRYHQKTDGSDHYKYTYYNECKKVRVRKSKKGITYVKNKSGELANIDVQENVQAAIRRGASTCAASTYSR